MFAAVFNVDALLGGSFSAKRLDVHIYIIIIITLVILVHSVMLITVQFRITPMVPENCINVVFESP